MAFAPDRRKIHIRAIIFQRQRQIYFCCERSVALGDSGADAPVVGNGGFLVTVVIAGQIVQGIIHISTLSYSISL